MKHFWFHQELNLLQLIHQRNHFFHYWRFASILRITVQQLTSLQQLLFKISSHMHWYETRIIRYNHFPRKPSWQTCPVCCDYLYHHQFSSATYSQSNPGFLLQTPHWGAARIFSGQWEHSDFLYIYYSFYFLLDTDNLLKYICIYMVSLGI